MNTSLHAVGRPCLAGKSESENAGQAWPVYKHNEHPAADVVLLGPGKVGGKLLHFLDAPRYSGIRLLGLANSRAMITAPGGIAPREALPRLSVSETGNDLGALTDFLLGYAEQTPIVIDATASESVARLHAEWLARGIHVITANKAAAANGWIRPGACSARYGDAATVGAGLPILSSIRRLKRAGDRITKVEGVLSGSLAYLFHALESGRDFSEAVARAQREGYTEPDPRCDLRGDDVARKLAIIARAAGFAVDDIAVPESLIPAPLPTSPREVRGGDHVVRFQSSDTSWRERVERASAENRVLRYVACATAVSTHIRTEAVPRHSPLAQTRGAEICVAIHSDAYRDEPLVIRGPGAGVEVTARALLADLAEIRT